MTKITLVLIEASQKVLKCRRMGWNDMAKDLHHKALFWHNIWESSKCPKTGLIANIRHSIHCKYRYSIKRTKHPRDVTLANQIASEMIKHDHANFWKDTKRLNGKFCKLPGKVEGTVGESNIAELFKKQIH